MEDVLSISNFACKICGEKALDEFSDFAELCRVTSDCKPFRPGGRLAICCSCGAVQKPTDEKWLSEIDEIYSVYAAYYQSAGVEQAVFDPSVGEPKTRSAAILKQLSQVYSLKEKGDLLDVGCGNGVLLTAFSSLMPNWSLNGQDLSEIALKKLSTIPGFRKLFTIPLNEITSAFDMVSMIHSLEHFPDPVQALTYIKHLLAVDGCLLVQVPNAEINPFDYLVADHASHFTLKDFDRMLALSELNVEVIADDWVTKEISVVATAGQAKHALENDGASVEKVRRHVAAQIDWLHAVVNAATAASTEGREFGIFGTSVAAMWLFGQLGDAVSFFVDEDTSRQGTELYGKPVFHPKDVAAGRIVFAGLIPPVAAAVAERLSVHDFEMRIPPELGA